VILDLIVAESQKNLQLKEELKNNISRLPRGIVKERKVNGKTYYYLAYRENRKVVNKYIGDNSLKAKKISKLVKERKAFENHLKQLQKDWKIYNKIGIEENSSELMQVITESANVKDFNLSLMGFLDIFYSNKDNNYAKTWDFKLESSKQLKLVVKVTPFNKPGDVPASGCVSIMFGFKIKK